MSAFNGICPACGCGMEITRFECTECDTNVGGSFSSVGMPGLSTEQFEFVKTFLRARGNIKEVERTLGISYPTVRNRLDRVVRALGMTPASEAAAQVERQEVLDKLDRGEISAEDAAKQLSGKKK